MTPRFIAIRPVAGVQVILLLLVLVVEVLAAVVGDAGEINFPPLKSVRPGFNGCAVTVESILNRFWANFFEQTLPIL